MDNVQVDEFAELAVSEYEIQLFQRGKSEIEVSIELHFLSWNIRDDVENDEVRLLKSIYKTNAPDTVHFDDLARSAVQRSLDVHSSRLWKIDSILRELRKPGKRENEGQLSRETLQVVVCSDVHLGTNKSNRQAFYQWLDSQSTVEVVLLGDILDVWLYGKGLDDAELVRIVSAEWKDLYTHLVAARSRGCSIHFIPGNHDAFIYYVEASNNEPWVADVLRLTPVLKSLKRAIKGAELLSVAQLHYPCYRMQLAGKTLLFTHGHYSSWFWRLLAGLDDGNLDLDTALVTASVSLAHKHARLLRRMNNEWDWLQKTHLIEDTAIAITNAVLSAYHGANEMLNGKQGELIEIVDKAMALYFGGKADVSAVEELNLRTALLHMVQNRREHSLQLSAIREDHTRFLNRAKRTSNIDLATSEFGIDVKRTALSDYAEFDILIFGHYHDPRDADGIHDSGSFVGFQQTFLRVDCDGKVYR